jgi:hypothetical protein
VAFSEVVDKLAVLTDEDVEVDWEVLIVHEALESVCDEWLIDGERIGEKRVKIKRVPSKTIVTDSE